MAIGTEALRTGGPGPPARPLASTAEHAARRRLVDRWASRLVVLGGASIILSILAILVVIVAEVYPLFVAPRATPVSVPVAPGLTPAPVGAVGVEEYREIAFYVAEDGAVGFRRLGPGAPLPPVQIPGLDGTRVSAAAPAVVTKDAIHQMVGTSDGRAVAFEVKFEVAYDTGQRSVTPQPHFVEPSMLDPEQKRSIRRLAFAMTESGPLVVGQLGPRDLVLQTVVEKKALIGPTTREASLTPLAVPTDGEVTAIAMDGRGDDLLVGTSRGQVLRYDLRERGAARLAERAGGASRTGVAVTAIGFLIGDRTIVVGDEAGGVSSWQVVGFPGQGERKLTRIHQFQAHQGPVAAIAPSRRDKGFATADASGQVLVHYGTSGTTLLEVSTGRGDVRSIAIAPKADGLLVQHADGTLSHWVLENHPPEITLQTLFGKVWYEGYLGPDFVWQSHGGTDDFEAKYSLTPLTFGTLKGTFYALLFAIPIALLAALYVSEFMHPTVKGYVKPVVEVMAALPSVVLGFIAGLWLAPVIERIVPGLFVLPVVISAMVLVAAALWRLTPMSWRRRFRPGTELLLVTPVVVVAAWVAFWVGGVLEAGLLGGDYRGWVRSALGLTYDQRNSIVVGVAMGFAVIPIIFTIAEDSLANVPQHLRAGSLALGATRWQTALRVVLPTASPGIFSAIMIGFGRAVGETMIVLMATGNTPVMDWSIFDGFRALSANIAVELPEAPVGHTHYRVLFLAALLLFCLTFAVNTVAELVRLRLRRKYRYL